MNGIKYAQGTKIVPLLANGGTSPVASAFVNITGANWLSFLVGIGANDTTSTITVQCCTANSTTGATLVQVPFEYRQTGEMGSDSWGAITTADTAGYALTSDYASVSLVIDIDPSDLAANAELSQDYKYVRLNFAATSWGAANPIMVYAMLEPGLSSLNAGSST